MHSVIAGLVQPKAHPGQDDVMGDSVQGSGIDAINSPLITFQVIDGKDFSLMVEIAVRLPFISGASCRFEKRHWRDLLPWRLLFQKADADMRIAGISFSIVEETKIALQVFHKRFAVRFNKHPYTVDVERITNRFR